MDTRPAFLINFGEIEMLKHASEIKLGKSRNKPRIWLESKVRLLDSGFVSGCHYNMTTQEGEITLTLSNTGDRLVSKKAFRK